MGSGIESGNQREQKQSAPEGTSACTARPKSSSKPDARGLLLRDAQNMCADAVSVTSERRHERTATTQPHTARKHAKIPWTTCAPIERTDICVQRLLMAKGRFAGLFVLLDPFGPISKASLVFSLVFCFQLS